QWSKIKEKKGINDHKKNVAYSRATREIMTAVRIGGGSADPEKNSALAAILRRLKDIPKENIQNALEKAIRKRDLRGDDIVYEALAYCTAIGLMIECVTDNPTRTFANIRQILNEHESRLAPVRFMFDRRGSVKVIASKEDELALLNLIDIAMDNGAENAEENASTDKDVEMEFTCRPESLSQLTTTLAALSDPSGVPNLMSSEIIFAPVDTTTSEDDPDMSVKISDLVRELEDNEDTKRVWSS
ncbi:transcriptional regulator TACO1-like protein, partial [Mycena capillaripes]